MPTARPIARRTAAASPAAALAMAALLALAGCARDGRDWSSAQDADTQEAYEAFLAKHPQSEFAPQAKSRAAQLVEERDWSVATQADSPESYRKFVEQHPDGKWTQEARIRVENFNVMTASAPEGPPAAAGATTPAVAAATTPAMPLAPAAASAVRAPGAASPGAAAGAAATNRAAAPGEHRVQLGAFSSVAKAEAEWARVRARFAPLNSLEPRITAVQTAAGRLFRLQAAGLPAAADAKALCDTLKAGGQACLYVPPK